MYSVKSNYRLKDIDSKEGVISAYVSIFNNVDSDGDMITPGAFAKTISERGPQSDRLRIKHLFQHSTWDIIGTPIEMKEDSEGLFVRSKFGKDQFSQDKLQQHVDGLLSEFSIGFQTIKSEKVLNENDEVDHYKLTELKLWEYSSVTWGANALTRLVDVKGDTVTTLERINDRMDKLTKALKQGKYTDETCEQFEIELKQIQTIYNEIIKASEPPDGTPGESHESTLSDDQISNILNLFK